jgi:isocitrate lyase
MAGKVLVPISEQINRLVALRLQCDIMGTETVIVGRTDSEAATLITSSIDWRDHPFILGATKACEPLVKVLYDAEAAGKSGEALQQVEDEWLHKAELKLYGDAVSEHIQKSSIANKDKLLSEWKDKTKLISHADAAALAKSHGIEIHFDWDAPRTREGFYRYQGGTKCAINRALAFAPYADLMWMETKKPITAQAKEFSEGVLSKFPEKKLAYNLSPSFNWDAAGMTDNEIEVFIKELGKLGFCWQFITLGGFHCNALAIDSFAKDYAVRGMAAYVQGVQRLERERKVETLQHQTWSGANYYDELIKVVQGGIASTAAMGKGVTEHQFSETAAAPEPKKRKVK